VAIAMKQAAHLLSFTRRTLFSILTIGSIVVASAPAHAGRPDLFDLQDYLTKLNQENGTRQGAARDRATGGDPKQSGPRSTAPEIRK
jgi:hypothetical protein